MRTRILLFILPTLAALFLLVAPGVAADSRTKTEYMVKAAYLYNFLDFVEWPYEPVADIQKPYHICILGKNPFSGITEKMTDKRIRHRKVAVHSISSVEELKECHLLYISASERDALPQILHALKSKSVLTVSDMQNFVNQGGMIGFVNQSGTIRFEINTKAAQQTGLTISSYLLKLARIIVTDR